jgi:hypothetical protein
MKDLSDKYSFFLSLLMLLLLWLTAKDTATCSDCASGNCPNTILANILQENKLTSGYMGISSSEKPKGINIKIINR